MKIGVRGAKAAAACGWRVFQVKPLQRPEERREEKERGGGGIGRGGGHFDVCGIWWWGNGIRCNTLATESHLAL